MSRFVDISNQRFGGLTALCRNGRDKHGRTLWGCRCDCGNEIDVALQDLRVFKRSCGCMRGLTSLLDLSGKRYGKLVAVRRNGCDKHGHTLWCCRCDCGNESDVLTASLRRGATKSCGRCSKFLDLTGGRFGDLVVLERLGVRGNDQSRWLCRCDCGKEINARYDGLKYGKTRSCGCRVTKKQAAYFLSMRSGLTSSDIPSLLISTYQDWSRLNRLLKKEKVNE